MNDPTFMDAEFMNIANEIGEEFKNTEVFSTWMPPDGEYTIILGKVDGGRSDKDPNDVFLYAKLPCTIVSADSDLNNKEFGLFYTSKFMQNIKRDSAILAGRTLESFIDAVRALAAAEGWVTTISVTRGTNKKGKPFTGTELLEVSDKTPGAEEAVS